MVKTISTQMSGLNWACNGAPHVRGGLWWRQGRQHQLVVTATVGQKGADGGGDGM